MAQRIAEDVLPHTYKPNGTASLFEGAVACNDGTLDGDSQGGGLMGAVLPNDTTAIDGGWSSFEGIVATGGYSSSPLFVSGIDRGVKLQKFGWAKARAKGSTTFNVTEPVGYVPSDGGLIVPLRVNPLAVPIAICRQQITTPAAGDFVTIELCPGLGGLPLGERQVGTIIADSTTATGSSEVAIGGAGGAIALPAGYLRVGSIMKARWQLRFTGKNGADTVDTAQLRFGSATGGILAGFNGATAAFASGAVVVLAADLVVLSVTTARVPFSLATVGTPGTPLSASTQASPGAGVQSVTIPTVANAQSVVPTIKFSSGNAGNTVVVESAILSAVR